MYVDLFTRKDEMGMDWNVLPYQNKICLLFPSSE